MLHGPRQVSHPARRLTIPRTLASEAQLGPGKYARVERSPGHPEELIIRGCRKPRLDRPQRDRHRVRRVTPRGQLSLPAELMDEVHFGPHGPWWVYFARGDEPLTIRVIPVDLVSVHVSGAHL